MDRAHKLKISPYLQSYTAQWDSEFKSASEYKTLSFTVNWVVQTLFYNLYLNITEKYTSVICGV